MEISFVKMKEISIQNKSYLMCKVTEDENKENYTKSPFFENPSDEGPSGNVVEENKHHGRKHPEKSQVSNALSSLNSYNTPADHMSCWL